MGVAEGLSCTHNYPSCGRLILEPGELLIGVVEDLEHKLGYLLILTLPTV